MRDREALVGTTSQASEVAASSERASAVGRAQGGRAVESRLSVFYAQMEFLSSWSPRCACRAFATGFDESKSGKPARYSCNNWERFGARANEVLGYDSHRVPGLPETRTISNQGMTVSGRIELCNNAAFTSIDIVVPAEQCDALGSSFSNSAISLAPTNI